jgi:hypothetical protein
MLRQTGASADDRRPCRMCGAEEAVRGLCKECELEAAYMGGFHVRGVGRRCECSDCRSFEIRRQKND